MTIGEEPKTRGAGSGHARNQEAWRPRKRVDDRSDLRSDRFGRVSQIVSVLSHRLNEIRQVETSAAPRRHASPIVILAPGETQAREHISGRDANARVDENRRRWGQIEARADELAGAGHHSRLRAQTDRHVSASRPGRFDNAGVGIAHAIRGGQRAQGGSGIRRTATKAGGDGKLLQKAKRPGDEAGRPGGEFAGGA